MRLYKTTANADESTLVRWSGTQADAASERRIFNSTKKIPRDSITTEEVEVPTNKQGLLEFLNSQEKRW